MVGCTPGLIGRADDVDSENFNANIGAWDTSKVTKMIACSWMQDFQRRHRYLEHIKSLAVIYFGLIQELHDVVTTLVRLGDAAVATALPNRTHELDEESAPGPFVAYYT